MSDTKAPAELERKAVLLALFGRCTIEQLAPGFADHTVTVSLGILEAIAVIGKMQVALRHSDSTAWPARVAREFSDALIAQLAEYPAHAALARLGYNRDYGEVLDYA